MFLSFLNRFLGLFQNQTYKSEIIKTQNNKKWWQYYFQNRFHLVVKQKLKVNKTLNNAKCDIVNEFPEQTLIPGTSIHSKIGVFVVVSKDCVVLLVDWLEISVVASRRASMSLHDWQQSRRWSALQRVCLFSSWPHSSQSPYGQSGMKKKKNNVV